MINKIFNELRLDETLIINKTINCDISIKMTKEFNRHQLIVEAIIDYKNVRFIDLQTIIDSMRKELEIKLFKYKKLLRTKGNKDNT